MVDGVKVKLELWLELEDEPGAEFLHRSVGVMEKGIWFWSTAWYTERKKPNRVK
jgi:hypothetical protein